MVFPGFSLLWAHWLLRPGVSRGSLHWDRVWMFDLFVPTTTTQRVKKEKYRFTPHGVPIDGYD